MQKAPGSPLLPMDLPAQQGRFQAPTTTPEHVPVTPCPYLL